MGQKRDILLSNNTRRRNPSGRLDLDVALMTLDGNFPDRQSLEAALNRADVLLLTTTVAEGPQNIADDLMVLGEAERARCRTFATDELARRFARRRRMLREVLGSLVDQPADRIRYRVGPHGKPGLVQQVGTEPLAFNIAHSGDLFAIALSRHSSIGVDIERVRPIEHWQAIAARVLTESENAQLLQEVSLGTDPGRALLRRWCRLEAELKAVGTGVGGHPARREPSHTARIRVAEFDEGSITEPSLRAGVAPTYLGAVAVLWPDAA